MHCVLIMKRTFDSLSAGVQRKRQKIRSARTIASESASNAINNGAIPIQEFLSSRRFEIKALTESVQKSREAGVQRAFQSLPRYLRRRAASHNVKRVPRRLRLRALAELTTEERKTNIKRVPFRRKRGRKATMKKLAKIQEKLTEPAQIPIPPPTLIAGTTLSSVKPLSRGKFVDRQRNKTWLPSHLWTCKRAKMETKWGYSLAISPNEKTYRSTHRASTSKGAIIFDTSYYGRILLKGPTDEVVRLMEKLTQSKHSCGQRARKGQRAVQASLFKEGRFLCPSTVMWDSTSTQSVSALLLSVHPAVYVEIWTIVLALRKACNTESVKVCDMRFQLGSIDIVGPLAINVCLSVLKAAEDDESSKAFRSFHSLSPDELSADSIFRLTVKDPRISFPPRMITEPAKKENKYLLEGVRAPTPSMLFSLDCTEECNRSKPKSGGLKYDECPAIPLIVHRTSLGLAVVAPWTYITDIWYSMNHLPLVRFGGLQELSQIHYENSVPFFPTDHQGTVAGDAAADEQRLAREKWYLRRPPAKRVSFARTINGKPEIGDPFMCDFTYLINTAPGATISDLSHISASTADRASGSQAQNLARVLVGGNDTTVDVSMEDAPADLTAPLFTSTPQLSTSLAHHPTTHKGDPGNVSQVAGVVDNSTQSMPKSVPKNTVSQDMLDTSAAAVTTTTTAAAAAAADSSVPDVLHAARGPILLLASGLATCSSEEEERGIVQVSVRMTGRGSPKSCARIYHAKEAVVPGGDGGSSSGNGGGGGGGGVVVGEAIGFLTTGNFSLAEGRATGLGSLRVSHVKRAQRAVVASRARGGEKTSRRSNDDCGHVCFVRDVGSAHFRLATWRLIT